MLLNLRKIGYVNYRRRCPWLLEQVWRDLRHDLSGQSKNDACWVGQELRDATAAGVKENRRLRRILNEIGGCTSSRLFYTERQVYDKYQKNIEDVLARTESGTIKSLAEKYAQPLGLDPYYCLALQLEQLKRKPRSEDSDLLRDTPEFKSLQNAYTSLSQDFINNPTVRGTLEPAPYVRVRIDNDPAGGFRAWIDFYSVAD